MTIFKKGKQNKPIQDFSSIELSSEVVHELYHLISDGNKKEAINMIIKLTGVGLRAARLYVDSLESRR